MTEIDPIKAFNYMMNKRQTDEVQFHLHPPGRQGASGLGKDVYFAAYEKSGKPIPEATGLRAETEAMEIGSLWHDTIIQPLLREYYNMEFPNEKIFYGEEIYIEVKMEDGDGVIIVVVTPVDIAFVTEPGYIMKEIEFKNITAKVPVKHPDAKWVAIYDIKSADDKFSYWKYRKEGPSNMHKSQMMVELKATGLPKMDILYFNKSKGIPFAKTVYWDEEYWNWMVKRERRKISMAIAIKGDNTIVAVRIHPDDLAYLTNDDDFECRYCPLSVTHDEAVNEEQTKFKVVLDKPCEPACEYVRLEAKQKYQKGGTFFRGRSHITITEVSGDYVYSENKGGTVYEDTIYYALKNFIAR